MFSVHACLCRQLSTWICRCLWSCDMLVCVCACVCSFLDDAFRKNLESALRFGNPLLVQDVESYDPILNPVLNRELRRTGGRVLITLGDQDIDLSPSFTIFLSTRDPTVMAVMQLLYEHRTAIHQILVHVNIVSWNWVSVWVSNVNDSLIIWINSCNCENNAYNNYLTSLCPRLPGWSSTKKVKIIWI